MSELERLRKEYDAAVKRRHGKIGATGLEIRADALIAALEAELKRVKDEKCLAVLNERDFRSEVEADLAAMTKREKVAAMFGDAFEDAAKGCHWMLEYERGLNHVIVSNWQYASRADEAYAAGYEAAHMDAEEQYEPRLAAAREDFAEVAKVLDGHCESCAKPYMALLSRYQPEEES